MDMSLSKLQGIVKDREAWFAAVHGVAKVRHDLETKQQQMLGQFGTDKDSCLGHENGCSAASLTEIQTQNPAIQLGLNWVNSNSGPVDPTGRIWSVSGKSRLQIHILLISAALQKHMCRRGEKAKPSTTA